MAGILLFLEEIVLLLADGKVLALGVISANQMYVK